ncbi:PRC-barrel domain-containing protein [Rubellimicrobium roseum]|uniref:PRC-barrel domain containing protein n=1 Tax=Rubellimicrobium roseum TaxID=687525 RepID=A0A5C4NQZ9_9RHOB|nr:PRC-barrel domain-containing protein [Rubellimicrobium roseum]TNC74829.1 PRC-barrel domain containing protein [Rubellimicrobium roseum]
MRTIQNPLLATAAVALLPTLALAQDVAPDAGAAVELPVDTVETEEATIFETDPATGAAVEGEAGMTEIAQDDMSMDVTGVEATSAAQEPMDLSTWTYDDLYATGISINEMMGTDVYGPEGDDIGDVQNVLFDMDGQVLSVVASIGGWLNLGDTHVNIPWEMISSENWSDGIVIPFTEDEVDDYVATTEQVNGMVVASEDVAEVGGDGPGVVETGPNVWRATDLLNNSARLREGEAYADYGTISDMVVMDGRIAAVLVNATGGMVGTTADGTSGTGLYGYPYAGQAGWTRGADGTAGTYDMPYDRAQAEMIQPFDPAMLAD